MAFLKKAGGWLVCWFGLLVLAGCMQSFATPPLSPANTDAVVDVFGLTLPDGYAVEKVVERLPGPTQMILGPDDRLWVAQLNGEENAGDGQVIAIDLVTGVEEVLIDELLKPTGIALLDGYLWIATRREIQRARLDVDGKPGAVEIVLNDLPFNGRSLGTLTVTPEQALLYETSGNRLGNAAVAGSAILWQLDPANPTEPQVLATGLKNAYAHTFDSEGRLWTTDIGDDPVNGSSPPDELNFVIPGADFGWPLCFGMQKAATNYGGTKERCQQSRAPVALFDPRATPTSVVASPWTEDTLFVALWLQQSVVQVTVTPVGDNATGVVEPFLTGLQNPQHLLVLAHDFLLVSDFAGTIYRVRKQ